MTGSAFAESMALTLAGGPVQLYASGKPGPPPVLLLHRAMLDKAALSRRFVAPELAKEHRIYAVDLPKPGGSRPWQQPAWEVWTFRRCGYSGQNDDLVGAGDMQAAAAASGGRLETIPDAGHLATLDQPQYFAALAGEFLRDP